MRMVCGAGDGRVSHSAAWEPTSSPFTSSACGLLCSLHSRVLRDDQDTVVFDDRCGRIHPQLPHPEALGRPVAIRTSPGDLLCFGSVMKPDLLLSVNGPACADLAIGQCQHLLSIIKMTITCW